MTSRSRPAGVMPVVFAWTLGVAVACMVTVALWLTVIGVMAATGMIRGPGDPGRATTVEAWFVHNWPIVLVVELVVGALVAMRVCAPIFATRRRGVLPTRRSS